MSGCRVFIGRLNPAAREKDVERFFKGYGRIRDIDLKRGFGFEFEDPRDADDAVYELDGKELCSERVTIEHARARSRGGRGRGRYSDRFSSRRPRNDRRNAPPVRTENRLIVENLSSRVSWQDLKDFMRQAGEVTFADAHRPKLNEGVVEFASYGDLKNAIEKLSGKEINGRKIKLIEGSKRHRSRSRSRSRTRSSSRSRSRSRSRRSKSYSRSRSRSRSRSKSRSGSRSPVPEKSQKRGSSSRSKSPASVDRQRSRSRSRSRSVDSGN
ncbi:serine/arginine-rich splicing factor 5 isoform 3 [Mus musculus]|uniref:serine/arginine-rich splicing factor 5 isoform 3 n=1 Tax=Mus musculus TaxID=10090 RepID=UPI0020D16B89|nr:serine/arginine-rich splicing factor 5 isoform 3 [Mus musculus]